jgi:hypothetical protein
MNGTQQTTSSNSTVNDDNDIDIISTDDTFFWLRRVSLTAILCTFIFGLTGNLIVMYIIGRYDKLRAKSVANYYIWNLALADFLYVLALPLTGWATYNNRFNHTFFTFSL